MAKKQKRISKKKVKKIEKEKVNKYTIFLGTFVLIIILFLIVFYSSFIQISRKSEKYHRETQPQITSGYEIVSGGICERDSQCFITYCRGNPEDCVNTTQLSDYSKNCKASSDWIIEMQDSSKCACVQNVCKMI